LKTVYVSGHKEKADTKTTTEEKKGSSICEKENIYKREVHRGMGGVKGT